MICLKERYCYTEQELKTLLPNDYGSAMNDSGSSSLFWIYIVFPYHNLRQKDVQEMIPMRKASTGTI
tara:strand:- start:682 stop:882 length:201 start_codon:yes stop_codon:yes gene_type:complete